MVGLCHGYAHAYRMAEALGCGREGFSFQMSGPNHFVWMNKASMGERDFFEALDNRLEECRAGDGAARPFGKIHEDFYRRHGVIGVGDTLSWTGACWPWFYHADEETEKEFDDYVPMDGWNGYFTGVKKAAESVALFAKDKGRSVGEFLGESGADDLIAPLVESLATGVPKVAYVNLLNEGGLVRGVPEDFAVEVRALCQRDEICPIKAEPLPKEMVAYMLRDRVAPVEMELEAFRTGRMDFLEELVLMDKWATSVKQVRAFIKEIMDLPYHREMKEHYK